MTAAGCPRPAEFGAGMRGGERETVCLVASGHISCWSTWVALSEREVRRCLTQALRAVCLNDDDYALQPKHPLAHVRVEQLEGVQVSGATLDIVVQQGKLADDVGDV